MGLRFLRATNSGSRHTVLNSLENIVCYGPEKKLVRSNHRLQGRNHQGVITCNHHGGGHKRLYRKIDFWRKKLSRIGYVKTIEYDPNRNARISLIYYEDGEKRYILTPKGLKIGQTIVAGFRVPIEIGNALALWNVPLGTIVHNVELFPGSGGKLARAAGACVQLIAREKGLTTLRLPSGEVRLVSQSCLVTVGQVGNIESRNKKIGKAGRVRWIGRSPTVRGSVINAVDHPHGGGEGRCSIGRRCPVTPWGKPRLGVKTRRRKKYSNIFILRRRKLKLCFFLFLWRVR
jgi:large subunit ribosomal protein L2